MDVSEHIRLLFATFLATMICAIDPALSGPIKKAPSNHYWRGGYFGPTISLRKLQNTYNPEKSIQIPSLNARGKITGAMAGYNFLHKTYMFGLEADIASGQAFDDDLNFVSTARMRLGKPFSYNMPYITGGIGVAKLRNSATSSAGKSPSLQPGLVIGVGFEQVLADAISGRLEYTYGRFFSTNSFVGASSTTAVNLRHLHMFKASLSIHFRD